MASMQLLVVFFAVVAIAEAGWLREITRKAKRLLNRPLTSVDVKDLEWSSCGGPTDLIQINSIVIDPIPFHLPGEIKFGFDFTVRRNITGPISSAIDLEFKINELLGWRPVPCAAHEGACPSSDVYSQTRQRKCEGIMAEHGVDCRALTNEGRHVLPKTSFTVNTIKLPSVFKRARYRGKVTLRNAGTPVACLRASFRLK